MDATSSIRASVQAQKHELGQRVGVKSSLEAVWCEREFMAADSRVCSVARWTRLRNELTPSCSRQDGYPVVRSARATLSPTFLLVQHLHHHMAAQTGPVHAHSGFWRHTPSCRFPERTGTMVNIILMILSLCASGAKTQCRCVARACGAEQQHARQQSEQSQCILLLVGFARLSNIINPSYI